MIYTRPKSWKDSCSLELALESNSLFERKPKHILHKTEPPRKLQQPLARIPAGFFPPAYAYQAHL